MTDHARVGPPSRLVRLAGLSVVVALLVGCTDSGTDSGPAASPPAPSPTGSATASDPAPAPAVDRPAGPSADLAQELTGGRGVFLAAAEPARLEGGYVEHEYVAAGRARSYAATGPLTGDGRWTFREGPTAAYRTRIVVRRPAHPAPGGTVLVEWLNVSGGLDADPEWATLHEEIVRSGVTWVGVSAQQIGVEGGPVAVGIDLPGAADLVGKGLKAIDPARYGSLRHPGDRFAYDIFTQVARAVRSGGPALGGVVPGRVVALGESQSAFALVTYVNGVQPLTQAFDGFFVHSRGATGLALPAGGAAADIASSIFGTPTTFRADTTVPVMDLQTETDVIGVLNSRAARQPDTDLFRLWEVAGTAHADPHLVGPATASALDCGAPINDGPLHVVAKAALHHFLAWVAGGPPPPVADALVLDAEGAVRDDSGVALGGVRTPPVNLPVRVLSGAPGRDDDIACLLFGSTLPLPRRQLTAAYGDRAAYLQRYDRAADTAIGEGFVLPDDRAALESYAHPELVAR